jgi:hypothetical protein
MGGITVDKAGKGKSQKIIKAPPISSEALINTRFWLGVAGFLLIILLVLMALSQHNEKPIGWVIIVVWLLIFIGWPLYISLQSWQAYRQAVKLENTHILQLATVVKLYEEDTSVGDQATTIVHWVVFQLITGELIKQVILPQNYIRLSIGQTIPVKAFPENPAICRAELE